MSFFRATTLVSKSYWRACFFVARVRVRARSRGIFELCNYACYIYIFSLLLFIKSNASFSKQKYKRFECVLESFRFAIRKFVGIVQLCGGNYFVFLGVIFFFLYIYKGMISNPIFFIANKAVQFNKVIFSYFIAYPFMDNLKYLLIIIYIFV